MAKKKLNAESIQLILSSSTPRSLKAEELSVPDKSEFENLSKQRSDQKNILFWSAIIWSWLSIVSLMAFIAFNAYFRGTKGVQYSLFANYELEVLSVSVFGQIVGIVAIIAKSLWDETPFTKMFEKDYDEKHKKKK